MPTYLIGAYWGPRAATAEWGASQLTEWVRTLAASGLFGADEWLLRRPGRIKAFSEGRLVCPVATLLRQMKHEITKEVMPEFGWFLSMYTAQGGDRASELTAHFGTREPTDSNTVNLILRTPTPAAAATLVGLMDRAVELFQPERAVVLDWDNPDPMDARPVWERPSLAVYPAPA